MVETNIQWEVTDTFGGEANYAWVERGIIQKGNKPFSDLAAVRAVKKAIRWNGHPCKVEKYGDLIIIRPRGTCQVCFITFHCFGSAS